MEHRQVMLAKPHVLEGIQEWFEFRKAIREHDADVVIMDDGFQHRKLHRDLDIVAVGPIVREVSSTFDEFWNSVGAVPIEVLVKQEYSVEDFRTQVAILRGNLKPERYPFPLEADLKTLRSHV